MVVDQRVKAKDTDGAIWRDKPLTVQDMLARQVWTEGSASMCRSRL